MGKTILLCAILAAEAWGTTAAPVTVTATPAILTFTYQSGATVLPKAQTVAVKASAGSPAFITTTPPGDFWLTVSLNSGTLPASISVDVNPDSLAVGTYTSSVTVSVTGVTSPTVVVVNLDITAPPSTLSLSPATLAFTAPPTPSAVQTISLTTDGAPISYSATSGTTWMTISPAVGIVLPGQVATLDVTVNAAALAPSATPYTAKITVVASGATVTTKSQNVTVTVVVNSVTPTITSIWPPSLAVNGGAQTITIRGANFYSASSAGVQVGATVTPLTTTLLSPSALLAIVPATMTTAAGSLNITVSNPSPGGSSTATAELVTSAPSIFGVFNAASYANASVSPGELVTLFGSNIGPATAATMDINGNYVNTSLSSVTVTIDGQNAPLLYVSSNQVTAQVPYEASIGAGKLVTLTNGANPAANTTITIAATAPGVFTADGSGTGQAAAINTSAATGVVTLNSTTDPAKIGDTLTLFLTGEGNYNTTLLEGAITTNTGFVVPLTLSPLPQMSPLPTVQIGGVDASAGVSYAGVVPGTLVGVLQMNVVVPAGSTTGPAVPLAISIGGNSTQSNVTLNIHP